MKKEPGVIVQEGMGGFLCPPTHPMHTRSVERDLYRSRANRWSMSLDAAVDCAWLDDETREVARKVLADWQRPPLDSAEVQEWIAQVLGYFRNCYRAEGPEPECWHASNLKIIKGADPKPPVDEHAGVHLIRRYYPEYVPTEQDFARAYWGTKPDRL